MSSQISPNQTSLCLWPFPNNFSLHVHATRTVYGPAANSSTSSTANANSNSKTHSADNLHNGGAAEQNQNIDTGKPLHTVKRNKYSHTPPSTFYSHSRLCCCCCWFELYILLVKWSGFSPLNVTGGNGGTGLTDMQSWTLERRFSEFTQLRDKVNSRHQCACTKMFMCSK